MSNRNSSHWIGRSNAFLLDLVIQQEQTAVTPVYHENERPATGLGQLYGYLTYPLRTLVRLVAG